MYRLLLILGLLVILYLLLRRTIREFRQRHLEHSGGSDEADQMVQDPVCHTFVPRKTAFVEMIGGQTYCFCSRDCAATFRTQLSR